MSADRVDLLGYYFTVLGLVSTTGRKGICTGGGRGPPGSRGVVSFWPLRYEVRRFLVVQGQSSFIVCGES